MKILRTIMLVLPGALLLWSCEQNEHAPNIENQEFVVWERGYFYSRNATIKATDADGDQNLSFLIIEGNEEGIFSLNHSNGDLSVSRPELLNYETVPQHFFKVAVSDNHEKRPLESTATIRINVLNNIDLSDKLLAYYPLNGDARDYRGIHHGEMTGAQFYSDRMGQNDSAVFFDGTDDYLRITDHDDFSFPRGDFSISFWIQPLSYQDSTYILSKGGSDQGREYAIGTDSDSRFFVSVYNPRNSAEEYRCTSTTQVNYSDWFHVTASWDGYMLSIIVNGERESSQACSFNPANSSSDLFIGTLDGDSQEASFHGVLDELFIHRRLLETWEFRRHYPDL